MHTPRRNGLFCSSCLQDLCTAFVVGFQRSQGRPVSYLCSAYRLYPRSAVLQCFCEQKPSTELVQGFCAVLCSALALHLSSFAANHSTAVASLHCVCWSACYSARILTSQLVMVSSASPQGFCFAICLCTLQTLWYLGSAVLQQCASAAESSSALQC